MTSGPGTGANIPLETEPFVIGRGSLAEAGHGRDGSLGGDPMLSRIHARVWLADGQPMIEDLGSSNGTLVNGRRIEGPTALSANDTILVGTTSLTVNEAPVPKATVMR
ncbi:MAG: FHA domain-containing protein, partial [Solirubrobacteraceae bacterium]